MTELKEAVKSLTDLGWSEYESKTYSALVKQGRSTASQIAKISSVPSNRVYQIIEKLAGAGHVKRITGIGGPSMYEAEDPNSVLDKRRSEYDELVENAKSSLEELKEREMDTHISRAHTIIGRREFNSHMHKLLHSATKKILLGVDTLVELRWGEVINLLNTRSKEIELSILTTERGIDNEYEQNLLRRLQSYDIEVKVSETQFSTVMLIIDGQKMLFTIYASSPLDIREEGNSRDYYGFSVEDVNTTSMFEKMFEKEWENAIVPNIEN